MRDFAHPGPGVIINPQRFSPSLQILFYDNGYDGKTRVALPLTYQEIPEGGEYTATTSLNPIMAQQLMDELYRAGIRPTEARDNTGALQATKEHLADMRRLVFDTPSSTDKTPHQQKL